LYGGAPDETPTLVLVSVWDSEDDAVEFFGGLIGTIEARYPNQQGDPETSTQDQVIWRVDPNGNRVNMLKLVGRQVTCIEGMPEPRLMRAVIKLESGVVVDDPAPEMRAREKVNLVWNRTIAPLAAGALSPRVAMPTGWTRVEPATDSLAIFAAQQGSARLELCVDRTASNELGLDGYAHQIAARLQARGRGAYVQTDIEYPRAGAKMYQHIFTQTEGTQEMAYCLGVFALGQGMGSLQVWGPDDGDAQVLSKLFYNLLTNMEFVPESGPSAPAAADASSPH
jgi:hypothetical protein